MDWLARADRAVASARLLQASDPDACASRAYYAAFYAASAVFASEGRSFRKHSALEAAVHRDLVRSGQWSPELGKAFSALASRRITGDYGGHLHVSADEAALALIHAETIVTEVRKQLDPT